MTNDENVTKEMSENLMDKTLSGCGPCCSHCGRNESNEVIAKRRGITIEEYQKERDECNQCCVMFRTLKDDSKRI